MIPAARPVCLEGTSPCAHTFHGECIVGVEWLSASSFCPLCRFRMPTQAEEDAAGRCWCEHK